MIEISLTAGRGTITVCGHDDADPELVAIRSLAARADAQCPESEWEGHADATIFDRLLAAWRPDVAACTAQEHTTR